MHRMIVALVLAPVLAGPALAQSAGERPPMLTVRGEGHAEVPPDHARLTVETATTARSLEQASAQHRDRAERALRALRGMATNGIEIERSSFRLDQVRQPHVPGSPPRPQEVEYRAVTTFELKSRKLDAIDDAITAVATTGLFEVHNLRFGLDEKNKGLNDARRNAVADARERANVYAQAAGVQLGDILVIIDTDARMPREFAAEPAAMARSMKVIPPETLTLNAGVTITWRIKGGT
ncbi:MAG: SIMPL domain-containing protein [Pseudorhodoplanes sp.]|nr:SIMPL domain-containing protein [Pseudorhodoplanes sp.]